MITSTYDWIRFIWQFVRRQKWIFFFIFFLDSFTWSLDVLLWPYILRIAIDTFIAYGRERADALAQLKLPICAAIGLVIYIETASRTMGFLMAKAMPKLQADLRLTMFDHIQRHSPHYFNERLAGSLSNKIADMAASAEQIIQKLFWPIVPAISTCILGAIFLWFVNPLFFWILLAWIIIHLSVCFKFARSCESYERRHGEARSTLFGRIVDSLTNNFSVNIFYRFRHEIGFVSLFQKKEEEANRLAQTYVEKMRCYLSLFFFVANFLGMLGPLVYLWLHEQVTTGQLVQVFNSMWSLTMILWIVGSALPSLFQSFGLAQQAYSVMMDPQDIDDTAGAQDLRVTSGEIVFDNVSFRYGDKQLLFENKHIRISGGERVGLVGFTGAGKSTFVNLILRLYPLQEGTISIDGQDIAHVTLKSLRRQIALIPQDPLLFHRTLLENIAYGKPEADYEKIIRASQMSYCDEFIRNIPRSYEARVGERGTKLSGGEKQRVAIARAILADAPVLILDEATSALDSVTEKYIQDSLEKLMQNRTTIVIAHRLSTLSRMDRLLVFDGGKIVEEGSHADLIKKKGLYARMWNMQAGGFLPSVEI